MQNSSGARLSTMLQNGQLPRTARPRVRGPGTTDHRFLGEIPSFNLTRLLGGADVFIWKSAEADGGENEKLS